MKYDRGITLTGQELIAQHPEVGRALQFHQQMQNGGGQPQAGQPPQPAPQQGAPQQPTKMPIPPDIQEREIILNAFAKHLGVLDSVLTDKSSQKPPQPATPPGQPPPQMLQMAQNQPPQGGQ